MIINKIDFSTTKNDFNYLSCIFVILIQNK